MRVAGGQDPAQTPAVYTPWVCVLGVGVEMVLAVGS
jgi:hypothetical protein